MTGPTSSTGKVVLSVDLPAETAPGSRPRQGLAEKLFQMLETRRLPASWVPRNTQPFSLSHRLATTPNGHDLALLGDPSWVGKSAGRTRFARELSARVEAARAANLHVSAIALEDVELDDHLDLLVKNRVGMIRGRARTGTNLQPQSVRFGVWFTPVSAVLPRPVEWSWLGNTWSLRQTIRRTIRSGGVAHLVIDGTQVEANPTAMGDLDLALAHVQRQRDKGALAVMSLSGLAATLIRQPMAKKATSILRAA